MAALVKNVFSYLSRYQRTSILDSHIALLCLSSPLRSKANLILIPFSNGSCRAFSSVSPPHNDRAAYQPRVDRRNIDGYRTRSEEDEPFHEDVDALGKLTKRHRENASSEHESSESRTFSEFDLHPTLLEALNNLGYKTPFEIQIKTLEHTLSGRDVIGQAVTGSGKTLAFAIPIVHKIRKRIDANERPSKSPRAIVVAPTRELCNQIYRSVQELDPNVRCVALYGGDSYTRQEREISRGVDVVCATPGRLNDHLERKTINVNNLEFLCLDEADELLNPNFREQIEDLFRDSPPNKQVLMFSATMPSEIQHLAARYMKDPQIVLVGGRGAANAPKNIEHQCICAPSNQFLPIIAKMISDLSAERVIVFLKTKVYCDIFANNLRRFGVSVDALHSDLSQSRRERILSGFRMGHLKILCATDVAARGLDIPEVDVVFQVEPPANGVEFYIHRAGRTGRAGRKGLAVLLHSGTPDEMRTVRAIGQMVKLNHVRSQEDFSNEIRERNLNDALQKLQSIKVSDKDKELIQPIAEKLLESEDNVSILSKALSLLSKVNVSSAFREERQISGGNRFASRPMGNSRFDNRSRSDGYSTSRRGDYSTSRSGDYSSSRSSEYSSRSLWNDD